MAGRQHINLEISDDLTDKADLVQIMSNSHINDHFQSLAREVRFNYLDRASSSHYNINEEKYSKMLKTGVVS